MNPLTINPPASESPRGRLVISAAIILFVIGVTLTDISSWMNIMSRILGIILVSHRLLGLKKILIPPEVALYGLFLLWSILSGIPVSINQASFLNIVLLVGQIALLVYAIAGIVGHWMDPGIPFLALVIGATIPVIYGVATGLFSEDIDLLAHFRFSAFMRNPNTLAHNLFMASAGLALFWGKAKTSGRFFLGTLMVLFSIIIVYSGSRKAFIGLLVFYSLWVWFCYRREIFKYPSRFLLFSGLLVATYFAVNYIYTSTYLGYRLTLSTESTYFLGTKRIMLYDEGWQYFLENPLSGVGLGNFQFYSSLQAYSHSDYMEILATTGMPGFILYYSIYVVLLARLFRLRKSLLGQLIHYRLGFFIAFTVTLLVLAVGRINSQSILTMFTLAVVIGYSFQYEQILMREKGLFHKTPVQEMIILEHGLKNE